MLLWSSIKNLLKRGKKIELVKEGESFDPRRVYKDAP